MLWMGDRLLGRRPAAFFLSGVLGLAVCYLFGSVWYLLLYTSTTGPVSIAVVLAQCVLPFILPDLVKLLLAMAVGQRLSKALECRPS